MTVGNVVDLHKRSIPLEDDELVEDLARYSDGTLSEAAVKARHHLSNDVWAKLGEDDELVRRIEDRKLARIRGGQTKRERAQIEVADAGPILGKLMRSPDTNARHVIDSVRALDSLATGGGEAAAAGTRFEIRIDLSAGGEPQVLHFNKSIEINCNDVDPNDIDAGPQDVIAAIAMNKSTDSDNGGHL
jgi:hypothetical protein